MGKQRSRRTFLRGAITAGAVALAGCVSRPSPSALASRSGDPVSLLAAGSLANAFENGLDAAVDVPLHVEARGSAALARMVADGQRAPDIVTLADVSLFPMLLSAEWYATFATNAIVVVYNPRTDGGARIAEAGADGWYEPLLEDGVALGRTDPALDPLGYRTLFTLDLAARYYDLPGLGDAILSPDQRYPETELISQIETGSLDAAFAYRSMAEDRGYPFVSLPDQIDLGHPAYAQDWCATVSYTFPDGNAVRGDVITYGSTLWADDPPEAVRDVFTAQLSGSYLTEFGFTVPDGFPQYIGGGPIAAPN